MEQKTICHISTVHSAFDDRIFYKECVSLAKAGFQVNYVVPHTEDVVVEGVSIKAIPRCENRYKRVFVSSFQAFRKALATKSEIYHFHDPELILVGIILKLLGKKVIYDMHELVYYQISDKEWLGSTFVRSIIASIYLLFEKIAVRFFERIVLAEDGYHSYVEKNYRSQQDKFVTIRNFSIISLIDAVQPSQKKSANTVIIYAGGITVIRGIKEIIQAINQLENIEFWLLGGWESEAYHKECMDVDKKGMVDYLGLVKMEEVYPFMKNADIGIANLYPLENYLTSLPVKAFEYMACDLPIIMSDFPYWQATFESCALFVDSKNPEDIAQKIEGMRSNLHAMKEMGAKGYKLVREKYSWEKEALTLVDTYRKIS